MMMRGQKPRERGSGFVAHTQKKARRSSRGGKGGAALMRARLMASRREMRPGPDDRCMPDFRKSHSRAPGAWPASPSIRSRVRARTHRSTLASGAVPRVIVPRAPPTDPSLCQPGHSRAHGMSAAPPPRAPIKSPLPGRANSLPRLTIIIPCACCVRWSRRRSSRARGAMMGRVRWTGWTR
jgi:hypothetical protein